MLQKSKNLARRTARSALNILKVSIVFQGLCIVFLKVSIRRALAQGVSDHLLFVFIATFVMSVKQLLHFLILLQHLASV